MKNYTVTVTETRTITKKIKLMVSDISEIDITMLSNVEVFDVVSDTLCDIKILDITKIPYQLKTKDIMKQLGVSRQRVSQMRIEEGLPYSTQGKIAVYNIEEVNKWLLNKESMSFRLGNLSGYITRKIAAEKLCISPSQFNKMVKDGTLPFHINREKRRYCVSAFEIQNYIDELNKCTLGKTVNDGIKRTPRKPVPQPRRRYD